MELGYQFANSLEMGLAGSLLAPGNEHVSSQQFYYEYSTDYLYTLPTTTQATIYDVNAASQFEVPPPIQDGTLLPSYTDNYQQDHIEPLPLESSVFLSPQTSAPSSAAQSPQAETNNAELFDLSLDELFDVDDILNNNEQLLTDELLDVLNDVGCSDYLSQLDHTGDNETITSDSSSASSQSSSPKRKYSTDSSDCYSVDSFETCHTASKKAKRTSRTKPNREERVARKKDQNKKAASRYRNKKKTQMQSSEQILDDLESQRDELAQQVKKLQTEFNVIIPLARAAFTFDPLRREHLNQLLSRINSLL